MGRCSIAMETGLASTLAISVMSNFPEQIH
jgi:hypothetical protein